MAKLKLAKSAVDAAQPRTQAVGLRDTPVPGFLCKVTPAGRRVFMAQYRTNAGERRKPALGLSGEVTVDLPHHLSGRVLLSRHEATCRLRARDQAQKLS